MMWTKSPVFAELGLPCPAQKRPVSHTSPFNPVEGAHCEPDRSSTTSLIEEDDGQDGPVDTADNHMMKQTRRGTSRITRVGDATCSRRRSEALEHSVEVTFPGTL